MPKKSFSSEVGAVPLIAIVVAVVALVAVGGFLMMGKSGNTPSVPGISNITLNPNCKHNDPDLCKFLNNYKEHKEFKVNSVMTDKKGEKTTGTYEISGKDKFHMMSSLNGKEAMNMIVIADTTYTKDYTDNKWWKQKATKETTDLKSEFDKDYDSEEVEDKTTYKKIGKEDCNSKQCFKYQVIDPGMSDSTEYIYFDDKEYLLRKTRSEDKEGNITEADYLYEKVNISEPSPTKDAAAGQMVVPGMGAMSESDQAEMKKAQEEYKKVQSNPTNYAPPADTSVDDYSESDGN